MIPVMQRSQHTKQKRWSFYRAWVLLFLAALLLAFLIRFFLYEPFTAPDASMERKIIANDLILVNKWIYHFRQPKRGDIVMVSTPQGLKISRIVGLPHEWIAAKQNQIWVNHKPLFQSNVNKFIYTDDIPSQKIPSGFYYLLGDSREESYDSRYFGPVSQRQMLGRVEGVYWPLSHLQFLW